MATAIAAITHQGDEISKPLINEADFGFKVDATNNRIIFSLKAINGIGTELVQDIIKNRPYQSMEQFVDKMLMPKIDEEGNKIPALIQTSKMVQLIKAGCFTELHSSDRRETMDWFLRKYVFTPCEKLGLQQFNKLQEMNIIPEEVILAKKMVNFKKYVACDEMVRDLIITHGKKVPKKGYHDRLLLLDKNSQPFFLEHFTENSIWCVYHDVYEISEKKFIKEVDQYIQPLKDWMSSPEALQAYNDALYQAIWDKHASGTIPRWNMQSLCFYDGEHELEHVNEEKYGIVNFFDLPEQPEIYDHYFRWINGEKKMMPKYKIVRITGTVLQADNLHHTVALLTKYGVVNVKFNKGHYAFYNRRISAQLDQNSDKKTVLEESWLKRGSLIVVAGIRRDDQFWPMVYKDTIYKHTVNLIKNIEEDGSLLLQSERTKV